MAAPPKSRRDSLLWSVNSKVFIKFRRPFDHGGSTAGYILNRGPDFFLLSLVHDGIRFDGFNCIRYKDVRSLEVPAKYARFVETALKKRNEIRPRLPRVSLSSIAQLLTTANRLFPLVTIHLEVSRPDVCYIGRVVSVDEKSVWLLEIGPDAIWDAKPTRYSLNQITRVDFGGAYEEALFLVGGHPPSSPGAPS